MFVVLSKTIYANVIKLENGGGMLSIVKMFPSDRNWSKSLASVLLLRPIPPDIANNFLMLNTRFCYKWVAS